MKEFDYEQYRVVAFVKEIKGDKVTIDVIGYCDDLYTFYPLTEAEAVEMFPTRGRIFAFEFARDYKHFNGCIVCLCRPTGGARGRPHQASAGPAHTSCRIRRRWCRCRRP